MRATRDTVIRLLSSHAAVGCALLAALVTFSVFPRGIMPVNDGFGYIRSILLTFQHGRPWTDDWLEPWAAGFSTLGAVILWGTRSMYLATYGLSAVLAGISGWLMVRLLVDRGVPSLLAGLVSLATLFFPTIAWKFIEVNCFSLYFVCLLAVIRFAGQERWGGFLFFWCLALCTRQTAVAWGAIPALVGVIAATRAADKRTAWKPWLVILAGAAWFFLVKALMNKTHSQTVITDHVFDGWSLSSAYRTAAVGLGVCLVGVGLGNVVAGRLQTLRGGAYRLLRAGLVVVISVVLLTRFDVRDYVSFDDGAFDLRLFRIYLAGVIAVAAVGLVTLELNLSRVLVAAAAGAVVIVTMRNVTWDYYLADAFFFSFFAVAPATARSRRAIAEAVALMVVLFSLCFVVHFKVKYDRDYALGTLGRQALEKGVVSPAEASFLPFGLMGWYYFPHYSQHEGKATAEIAAFGDRMRQNTFEVAVRYPWPLRRLPQLRTALPQDRFSAVAEGRFSFCWFTHADYRLSKAEAARVREGRGPFPSDFKLPVFPADDQGWWELAQTEPR